MRTFAWDDLKHFLAFARAGSMQGAAKALGVNQSTVQRRITELEECVGHRLVQRHLGSYQLTPLGEQLQPAAEGVEAAVASFERHLAACDKGLTGTVGVTCGSSVAACLRRTPLIDAFHARYPGLRVELVISDCPRAKPTSRCGWANPLTKLWSAAELVTRPGLYMPAVVMWNGTVGRTIRTT